MRTNTWNSIKISMKLLVPHLIILALLAAGAIVSFVSVTNIRKQAEHFYDGSFAVKNTAQTMNETLEAMQASLYRAISNDAQDITGEAISEARNQGTILQEQLARLIQNPSGDMEAIAKLENDLSELERRQEQVLVLAAQNKKSEALAYMEDNQIPVIEAVQTELAQFILPAEATERELMDSLRRTQRNAIILLVSLGAVSVLFAARDGAYIWRLYRERRGKPFGSAQMK